MGLSLSALIFKTKVLRFWLRSLGLGRRVVNTDGLDLGVEFRSWTLGLDRDVVFYLKCLAAFDTVFQISV